MALWVYLIRILDPHPLAHVPTQVPLGEEYAVDPTTGLAYKVRWGTDESGNLCVLDCTPTDPAQIGASGAAAGKCFWRL